MSLYKTQVFALLAVVGLCFSSATFSHVSITNKMYSNSYNQVDLAIPHGCEGYDTVKIEVTLPEGLTSVRPINTHFGSATIEKNEQEVVTKITWTNTAASVYPSDTHAYLVSFRAKTPEAPFRTLYFPSVQTCEDPMGTEYTSAWVGMGGHHHDAASAELPAPKAMLYPKTTPGWNFFVINEHVHDLSVFNDAEILWYGSAAYSGNAKTLQMIQDDSEATVLDLLHPGSEIWVKY